MSFLPTFFQSLNSWEVLIFSLLFMSAMLLIHNRWPTFLMGTIINVICILFVSFFISNPQMWVLFLIGSISNHIIDAISVYRKEWRYNTESGYVMWAGIGWGFMTILVYVFAQQFDLLFVTALLVTTILFVFSRLKTDLKAFGIDPALMLFTFGCLLAMPKVFIIAFCFGIFLEFLAVEILKTWEYRELTFLHIGLGYGALVVASFMLYALYVGHFSWQYLFILSGLLLSQIYAFAKEHPSQPAKKQKQKK